MKKWCSVVLIEHWHVTDRLTDRTAISIPRISMLTCDTNYNGMTTWWGKSLNRFDRILACNRRTDGRTNILRQHGPRYAYHWAVWWKGENDLFVAEINAVWKFCFAAEQLIWILCKFTERHAAIHAAFLHMHTHNSSSRHSHMMTYDRLRHTCQGRLSVKTQSLDTNISHTGHAHHVTVWAQVT